MTICNSYLKKNIDAECQVGKGYYAQAVIINYDDILETEKVKITQDGKEQDGYVVTDITLVSGKTGYYIEQLAKNAFDGTQTALEAGDVRSTWTHTVAFKIFSDKQDVIDICNNLANGNYVIIVKGKTSDETAKYQIYGLTNGLVASEITREGNGDDGFVVNVTMTEEDSSTFANVLWKESATATEALFKTLGGIQ